MRPLAPGAKWKEGSGSNACKLLPTHIDFPSFSCYVSTSMSQCRSNALEIPFIWFLISFCPQPGIEGGPNETNAKSKGKP